ncbi:MAG: hypothetical protein VKK04_12790, partial [Synechococcales bacterium]|nr:hypothetical protein [Synechococcales bacterium]
PMRAIVPEYAVYFRRLLPFLDWAKENHPVISVDRAIASGESPRCSPPATLYQVWAEPSTPTKI